MQLQALLCLSSATVGYALCLLLTERSVNGSVREHARAQLRRVYMTQVHHKGAA
jgi:hypothetical protein